MLVLGRDVFGQSPPVTVLPGELLLVWKMVRPIDGVLQTPDGVCVVRWRESPVGGELLWSVPLE